MTREVVYDKESVPKRVKVLQTNAGQEKRKEDLMATVKNLEKTSKRTTHVFTSISAIAANKQRVPPFLPSSLLPSANLLYLSPYRPIAPSPPPTRPLHQSRIMQLLNLFLDPEQLLNLFRCVCIMQLLNLFLDPQPFPRP